MKQRQDINAISYEKNVATVRDTKNNVSLIECTLESYINYMNYTPINGKKGHPQLETEFMIKNNLDRKPGRKNINN